MKINNDGYWKWIFNELRPLLKLKWITSPTFEILYGCVVLIVGIVLIARNLESIPWILLSMFANILISFLLMSHAYYRDKKEIIDG